MTKEEALFFAELWLSDKCNRSDNIMYQFMTVAFDALSQDNINKKEMLDESISASN